MGKHKPPLPNSLRENREFIRELKRKAVGDPNTGKLKIKNAPLSISGKRKRKLFNRMWKEHKEALLKGLETMDDMEMVPVDVEAYLFASSFLCRIKFMRFPPKNRRFPFHGLRKDFKKRFCKVMGHESTSGRAGTSQDAKKSLMKFFIRKNVKVKLKKKRGQGKVLMEDSETTVDAMEE